MHFSSIIFSTLLASAAASAIPDPILASPLLRRGEAVWDPKGNIRLTFSSEIINIGGLKIEDMFAQLVGVCHTTGMCETNDITMDSTLTTASSVTALAITMGPSGVYPTWIRNGLIDTLRASVLSVAKCTPGTHTDTCPGVSAMAYCPRKKTKFINCEVPKFWGINYQTAESASGTPPSMGVKVKAEVKGASGACEAALTALGAVAGAVNGAAGGVFTLFTFLCT
ncbi:hypothetical protein CC86DRAFT_434000 [Ophiobolus disseminans]|uniref:Uncharacterized protein n=1 Tax=Ophiobolus disseminans TaxID=1469910 RepID=A0A6A7AAR2_9PLEO|nr:hypothetical protein CC86DRAFT_434000 [Ophiobolus disseminans]